MRVLNKSFSIGLFGAAFADSNLFITKRGRVSARPNRPTQGNHTRLGRKPRKAPNQRCLIAGKHHRDLRTDTQSPTLNPSRATKRAHKEGGLNIKMSKKQYLFAFEPEETSGLTTTNLVTAISMNSENPNIGY